MSFWIEIEGILLVEFGRELLLGCDLFGSFLSDFDLIGDCCGKWHAVLLWLIWADMWLFEVCFLRCDECVL